MQRSNRDLLSFGSMVQKGKFSAGAEAFVNTLKKVDLLYIHTHNTHTHIHTSPGSSDGLKERNIYDRPLTQR